MAKKKRASRWTCSCGIAGDIQVIVGHITSGEAEGHTVTGYWPDSPAEPSSEFTIRIERRGEQ